MGGALSPLPFKGGSGWGWGIYRQCEELTAFPNSYYLMQFDQEKE
jgi:hypothetical protein